MTDSEPPELSPDQAYELADKIMEMADRLLDPVSRIIPGAIASTYIEIDGERFEMRLTLATGGGEPC